MERRNLGILLIYLLALVGCASPPPAPPATKTALELRAEALGLVEVRRVLPGIQVDLRYARNDTILGAPVYPRDLPCFLKYETAQKLRSVRAFLGNYGYDLKIWDGWRPVELQAYFFQKFGHTGLFLDPKVMWSRHCTGTAVDLTLVRLGGYDLDMPTDFDAAGEEARYNAVQGEPESRRRLAVLQNAMVRAGFSMIDTEWWHFDDVQYAFNQPTVISAADLGVSLTNLRQ
jgi:D-alanyl-D-alanine dipeptidase